MRYYLRLGRYPLEKSIIETIEGDYGLTAPAHILSFYRNSLRAFLSRTGKRYFIDPMTYVFGTDPKAMKREVRDEKGGLSTRKEIFKKSYLKLLEIYDKELVDSLDAGTFDAEFFTKGRSLESFVEKTLDFQSNFFQNVPSVIRKYEDLLEEKTYEKEPKPEFLVTPYFYFRNTIDPWYVVCRRIADHARTMAKQVPTYASLCFDKTLLRNEQSIDKMIADFFGFDGYVIMISGYTETNEDLPELVGLKLFFKKLKEAYGKPIVNLYGSYFSAMLASSGLDGFSSGLCINDHKDFTSYMGISRAQIRFYLPAVHMKLMEEDTKTLLVEHGLADSCSCDFCEWLKRILSAPEGIDAKRRVVDALFRDRRNELLKGVLSHFLFNRLSEIAFVNASDSSSLIKKLQEDLEHSNYQRYSPLVSIDHLTRWSDALHEA